MLSFQSLTLAAAALVRVVLSQELTQVIPASIPLNQRSYDFSPASRCRIYAHTSCILGGPDQDSHMLVIESGHGMFATELNGSPVSVTDLNGHTAAFDLSKDFYTRPDLDPLWQIKKPSNGPARLSVWNTGGIWASEDSKTIWTQGGHYFHGANWNTSEYYVAKSEIPPWQLWKLDVDNVDDGWTEVAQTIKGHDKVNRTYAGAYTMVKGSNKKFWLGGLFDETTSPDTPVNVRLATKQMLVFDESTSTVSNTSYYQPTDEFGAWQGTLTHLPIGAGSGYLISLMAISQPIGTTWVDEDGPSGNLETGTPISLEYIPMYDIDRGVWFNQRASWFMSDMPQPRTRFCSALFRNAGNGTDNGSWELWMHGGQQVEDQDQGVQQIYVLSMPSFIWTVIETALPETNLIRSHTCHAVGNQLLIVGGYPTGLDVTGNVTCDPEYVKVLQIGEDDSVWTRAYGSNTTYKTPSSIVDVVAGRVKPYFDFSYSNLATDFTYVKPITTPSATPTARPTTPSDSSSSGKSTTPIGAIVGGVVGGVLVIGILALGFWFVRRRTKTTEQPTVRESQMPPPRYATDHQIAEVHYGKAEVEGSTPMRPDANANARSMSVGTRELSQHS